MAVDVNIGETKGRSVRWCGKMLADIAWWAHHFRIRLTSALITS